MNTEVNYRINCYFIYYLDLLVLRRYKLVTLLFILLVSQSALANNQTVVAEHINLSDLNLSIKINSLVRENERFHGLASYYNGLQFYIVDQFGISPVSENNPILLEKDQWLSIVGRFKVLLAVSYTHLTLPTTPDV